MPSPDFCYICSVRSDDRYIFNPETLKMEREKSSRSPLTRAVGVTFGMAAVFALYLWLYSGVLGFDLPKTAILKRSNARWSSRMETMNARLDAVENTLEDLEARDNEVYKLIFDMEANPPEDRNLTIMSPDIPDSLKALPPRSLLLRTDARLDTLMRLAFLRGRSYDRVEAEAERSGDMASHIPAIPPLNTDPSTYRLSSPFGYRSDPIHGGAKRHTGMDFACPPGNPVHCTGDGVVEVVKSEPGGYGNSVVVNHGYGYKTRYAHMNRIDVVEGQKLSRGDRLGVSGNTGRSTGPHLHYEVMYGGDFVNPADYMALELPALYYASLVGENVEPETKPAGKASRKRRK